LSGVSLRRNALLLAIATALVAVAADWNRAAGLAGLWGVPCGLLLFGLAYESWVVARSGLSLVIEAPQCWLLGRRSAVRFGFAQGLRRQLTIEFAPSAPAFIELGAAAVVVLKIPAQDCVRTEHVASACRLGAASWPRQRVRIAGPLGLAWWPRVLAPVYDMNVVPDMLHGARGGPGADAFGSRTGVAVAAGGEFLRLRAYRVGDPPRVIDWRATARSRRLISRDYASDQRLEMVIVVDAGRASGIWAGELDRFGHYVNVAARLAQYAASYEDMVGLVTYAAQPLAALAPARGTAAVMRMRALLAASSVEVSESNALQAAIRVCSLVRQRSLIVLLTDLDDTTATGQLVQAVRLLLPKHLPFVAALSSAAAETLARAPAREWLDPYRALAAQEYRTGQARKVRALNALGAPTLVARPEQLERAVLESYANLRRQRRA